MKKASIRVKKGQERAKKSKNLNEIQERNGKCGWFMVKLANVPTDLSEKMCKMCKIFLGLCLETNKKGVIRSVEKRDNAWQRCDCARSLGSRC